jgi:translation initiation factor IF-2
VRIYSLAKDLDIDSKELVEICRKAGIPGKGSALASLTDDEVVKLKAYLSGGDKRKAEAGHEAGRGTGGRAAEPVAYARSDYISPGMVGKIKVLDHTVRRPPAEKAPLEPPAAVPPPTVVPALVPAAAEQLLTPPVVPSGLAPTSMSTVPPVEPPVAEQPPVAVSPVAPLVAVPVVEQPPVLVPPDAGAVAEPPPDALMVTARAAVEPPLERPPLVRPPLDRPALVRPQRPAGERPASPRPKKPRAPVIKLAELPEVKQPLRRKSAEPKAQKPEIRLPKDAIAGHRAGQRASLEELARAAAKPPEPEPAVEPAAGRGGPPDRKKSGKVSGPPTEAPLSGKAASKRRKAGDLDDEAEVGGSLAGMASARADRQKLRKQRARNRLASPEGEMEEKGAVAPVRKPRTLVRSKHGTSTAAPRKEKAALELPCTVRTFSEATGVSSGQILKVLMGMGGTALNINAQLDNEFAQLLASELGIELEFKQKASLEETVLEGLSQETDAAESLTPRPPVATFLGHVDHGKTSLLDAIIGTHVAAGEAGGITQHIRAYQIEKNGRRIAFVDTPGHEAFTEMRARGANVTDIAVLVVAADDGVMPQTEEAISHAKAAGVPIIVALNKIDLPGVDPNRVQQQLAAQGLLPSQWGGDVEVVATSATKGTGINDLLETILLTADMHDYKANPHRLATGVCLEAAQEAGRGVIAKLIVQNGTLRVGDVLVCGSAHGRVKAMYDTLRTNVRMTEAGPSTPANITGFDEVPEAGERFYVLEDIAQAREIALQRASRSRQQSLSGITVRVSFEEFQRRLAEGNLAEQRDVVTLNLIVRADARGSIEAIEKELVKLDHPEVQVKVLHKSVGAITAGDVMLAHASQAVVIGFNVIPDEAARSLADEKQVEIRRYDIIYKVTDDIRALLEGKLKPEERIVELGHALVKRVFPISRIGTVAGCYVIRGLIARGCRIRVNRDGRTIGDYELESLRREKDDAREVPRGMECGIKLAGFNDVKQDDILEAYRIEEVARTL